MRCPACQKDVGKDDTKCPACGVTLDDAATQRFDVSRPPSFRTTYQKSPDLSTSSYDPIDDAAFVPGTMLADRYRIVGLLGKGGMGEVYRADDLKLSQPVALKFLPDHLLTDGAALARFHREVRIAREVSHRNVCRVYDIGEVDGRHFLSMEYIKGEELSSLLHRIGRLPSDKALQIARQLCAGVAAAHDRGVLHRDLKPANVMIDGDGNVRITDFGIAGLVEEVRDEESRVGTPAYMSPEQLAGTELTVKSDIYSLGLVLYELFTGKKAFSAPTLPQLLNLRNSDTTPTSPSTIVKDMEPLVERVILRCIEKDPEKRPASALQVAASLPGGDPLAAALAAGETPSPEMVAAAPKEGLLKPAVAISLLAFILIAIGAVVVLSEKTELHRRVTLEKSPEALKERARTIIAKMGYTDPPADSTYGLGSEFNYLRYLDTNPSLLPQLPTSQPASLYFWYRESADYLIPAVRLGVRATEGDPPATRPGMIRVKLDPMGRLIEFVAAPPQQDESSQVAAPPNWSALFEEAGLNQTGFTSTPSKWIPPVNSDSRAAWEGTLPNQPQIPIRIEAAAYAGKPVFFQIIGPWNSKGILRQTQPGLLGKLFVFGVVGAMLAFVIIGVLLGRRNLRAGSGDRKGGARLAIYIFLALMVSWVFRAHHYGANEELNLLFVGVQFALLPTVLLWLFYLALEPYVRRWWPHRIISWSRLLAGDFRDPLIGRDLLIGSVFGMAMMVVANLWALTPEWLGHPRAPRPVALHTLLGVREAVGEFFFTGVTLIVFLAVACLFFLLLLHIIFRRKEWIALAVAWLLFTLFFGLGSSMLIVNLPYSAIFSALVIAVATRFGLLALTAALFFTSVFGNFPMTTDFSVWYASSTIFALATALSLVAYAFYTSLGGQPVFKGGLLRE
ncbi:MAG: protein kinase [Pyrinomonadaceae bacterium]